MTIMEMVAEFHRVFGRSVDPTCMVDNLSDSSLQLRANLIVEELKELVEAVQKNDKSCILQEMADLQYVVAGFALTLGISEELLHQACSEVHRANMSKLGPGGSVLRREDGKVLKGPRYQPPDMHKVLAFELRGCH